MTGDDKIKLATTVSAKARIADLRLWAAHCRYGDVGPQIMPETIEQLSIKTTVGFSREGGDLRYLIQFQLQPASTVVFFHIEASYVALFKIEESQKLSDEQVGSFGEVAVVHMIWPFFREFVTSTAGRMALPNILLPLRQLAPPEEKDGRSRRVTAKRGKRTKRLQRKG